MPKKIVIKPKELWNEKEERFITIKQPFTISIEHSLVSVAKWESRNKRPYLMNKPLTNEELLDYLKCMTLTQNVPDDMYYGLIYDPEAIKEIDNYINDPMTATTFRDRNTAENTYRNKVITAEEIYFLMFANNIPVEFQKWHLNRLLALIKLCSIKNAPPKKMSKGEMIRDYAAINKANRAKFNTKG